MFDLILRGGSVIDGTGAPAFSADVGIQGDRIAAVERLAGAAGRETLDVGGRIVAPGFIDVHNHSDGWMLKTPHLQAKTLQGFTTEVLMADGISYAPVSPETATAWMFYLRGLNGLRMDEYGGWQSLRDYTERLDGRNVQNSAIQIPYANVRTLACGFRNRAVDDFQMRQIQQEIRRGMEAGAVGLSTGLDYLAQCFSTTDEIVSACEPLRGGRRPYVTHVRYKRGLLSALEEAADIGRRAQIPVHISHLKVQPPYSADQVLEFVDRARRDVDLTFDVYPYQPGSTMLNYLLPYEVWDAGPLAALGRLEEPGVRARFLGGLADFRLDLDHIRIAWLPGRDNARWIGQPLSRYVAESGKPAGKALSDLLIEERLGVLCVFDEGDDALVHPFLAHDLYMMGTDGIFFPDGHVHPRMFGSAGRLLGPCVRDLRLFTLEEAVYRLAGFAARRFGLHHRGEVRVGHFADLVVFDADRVCDRATYENPRAPVEGVDHVMVNGVPIVRQGVAVDFGAERLPGRYLPWEGD